jgi:glyoxylase-like metal-dependent hydrolase (beta-lactamase superfamily II)
MKRILVLSALLTVGALLPASAGDQSRPQGPRIVRMRTLRPGDIVYVLLGGGGNTLALMREDGVVVIDTKSPGWGRPILDAIQAATDRPVTTIINTHAHADHTSGNVEFQTVTRIVAHERTKAHMQRMDAFKGSNTRFLPNMMVTGNKTTLFDGPDRLDLYYFGAGHTDGDLVVVLPEKRIAYFGDLFPSKAAPFIDTANGGSGVAFPQTLARAAAEIKGVDQVVTGHEEGLVTERDPSALSVDITTPRTMSWSDVQEYADFNRDFLAAVQEARQAGKTVDEAAATLRLSEKYKAYDMQRAKTNVEAIYSELRK